MADDVLKIVAIDDVQDNLITLRAIVRDAFRDAIFLSAQNGVKGLELILAEDPDVVLLDIVMPGMDGFEVCRKLKADSQTGHIPVIFLTALQTERASRIRALEVGGEAFLAKPIDEVELTAMIKAMAKIKKANAAQRLEKERLAELVAERTSELEKEFAQHRKATAALRESEKAWRQTFDSVPDLISIIDSTYTIIRVNQAMADRFGLAPEKLVGCKCHEIVHDQAEPPSYCPHMIMLQDEHEANRVIEVARLGGIFDVSVSPMADAQGNIKTCVHIMRDVTARKKAEEEKSVLEARLRHIQQIESIGRLAGGVAHDFNNMLGVILGHADLAMMNMAPSQPLYSDLNEIRKAAERSADLTRQLLAFARKQTVVPKVLDLNETVKGMLKMLQRLIGEDISLQWHPQENIWPVRVDPSQVDQIMANLCVNARDSITNIGNIKITTENTSIDSTTDIDSADIEPGDYVCLSVEDNGSGMDNNTLAHIFEPFFTTKGVGEGTGLGLATVYGAVKQNSGFIKVSSQIGSGTLFRIFLPRHQADIEHSASEKSAASVVGGSETILLVEDETTILKMAKMMLEKQGYTVLATTSSNEALSIAQSHSGSIDLLMTDVVMPDMNGRELSDMVTGIYPELKCLFMSGYTSDIITNRGVLAEGLSFIHKPFTLVELNEKVRMVLDGKTV